MDKEALITLRIERSKFAQLKRLAKKKDLSVSWLIRQAINRLLREKSNADKD